MSDSPKDIDRRFRDLFPGQSDHWLREAQETFDRYLDLILRIYARIWQDPPAYAAFPDFLREGKRQNTWSPCIVNDERYNFIRK